MNFRTMVMHKVTFLFGGVSSEHDASVKSFEHVLFELKQDINSLKFIITEIVYLTREREAIIHEFKKDYSYDYYMVGQKHSIFDVLKKIYLNNSFVYSFLHGQNGEDGNIQGLSNFLGIHGNFGTTLSCSIGMSKYHMNQYINIFKNLLLPKTIIIRNESEINRIFETFPNYEIIIKPNSLGASLFTEKLQCIDSNMDKINGLVVNILKYDSFALIQEYIKGNEYTCGCIEIKSGTTVLPLICIKTKNDFFGHEEKHVLGFNEEIIIIEREETVQLKLIKDISKKIFEDLNFRNKARFDYIVNEKGIYFLEVNPFPGLMKNSLFTKMIREQGISMNELIYTEICNFYATINKQTSIHYKID